MGNRDRAGIPIGIHASVKSPSIFSLLKATRIGFRLRGHSQNTERAPFRTFSAPEALAVYLFEC
jgi:hypothetical protein